MKTLRFVLALFCSAASLGLILTVVAAYVLHTPGGIALVAAFITGTLLVSIITLISSIREKESTTASISIFAAGMSAAGLITSVILSTV